MTIAASERPPFWRNVRVLKVLAQAALLLAVGLVIAWLWTNLITNLNRQGIDPPTDFGYLDQPVGTTIPGSDLRPTQSRFDALMVGLQNTLKVAVVGIILATVFGVLLGIARLSSNWLVKTAARIYVEVFRNTPPLVVIVFVYLAIFIARLPPPAEAWTIPDIVVADVRGISIIWFSGQGGSNVFWALCLLGVVAGFALGRWRHDVGEAEGRKTYPLLAGIAAFAVIAAIAFVVLGGPVGITTPVAGENGAVGGSRLQPEYAALLLGLVLYTASHIAEIVRGSIQAVPRGQSEAGAAVALSSAQRMRFIILPQAMRIAVPPLANQYLNLTKNSSLAIAIAYVELTKVTSDFVANGAPAIQNFTLLLAIYLMISLAIAALTNLVNWRLSISGRRT